MSKFTDRKEASSIYPESDEDISVLTLPSNVSYKSEGSHNSKATSVNKVLANDEITSHTSIKTSEGSYDRPSQLVSSTRNKLILQFFDQTPGNKASIFRPTDLRSFKGDSLILFHEFIYIEDLCFDKGEITYDQSSLNKFKAFIQKYKSFNPDPYTDYSHSIIRICVQAYNAINDINAIENLEKLSQDKQDKGNRLEFFKKKIKNHVTPSFPKEPKQVMLDFFNSIPTKPDPKLKENNDFYTENLELIQAVTKITKSCFSQPTIKEEPDYTSFDNFTRSFNSEGYNNRVFETKSDKEADFVTKLVKKSLSAQKELYTLGRHDMAISRDNSRSSAPSFPVQNQQQGSYEYSSSDDEAEIRYLSESPSVNSLRSYNTALNSQGGSVTTHERTELHEENSKIAGKFQETDQQKLQNTSFDSGNYSSDDEADVRIPGGSQSTASVHKQTEQDEGNIARSEIQRINDLFQSKNSQYGEELAIIKQRISDNQERYDNLTEDYKDLSERVDGVNQHIDSNPLVLLSENYKSLYQKLLDSFYEKDSTYSEELNDLILEDKELQGYQNKLKNEYNIFDHKYNIAIDIIEKSQDQNIQDSEITELCNKLVLLEKQVGEIGKESVEPVAVLYGNTNLTKLTTESNLNKASNNL